MQDKTSDAFSAIREYLIIRPQVSEMISLALHIIPRALYIP